MEIRIDSLLAGARAARGVVIVIDVFRAFTTAAVAFSRGATKIIICASPEQALTLRNSGAGDLCMGEVRGIKPKNFDFGNSPHELSRANIEGVTLIQSTQAGTVGINAAANGSSDLYLGALINAKATASAISETSPDLVTIVAMGAQALVRTDEDEQCALYLRNLLQGRTSDQQSVRNLVLAGHEAQKYGDPSQSHFLVQDRKMALDIDSIDFAIRVQRVGDLLVARPLSD